MGEKGNLKNIWKVGEEIKKKWKKFEAKWWKIEGGKVGVNEVCRERREKSLERERDGVEDDSMKC